MPHARRFHLVPAPALPVRPRHAWFVTRTPHAGFDPGMICEEPQYLAPANPLMRKGDKQQV
jgi:hypothetical protein